MKKERLNKIISDNNNLKPKFDETISTDYKVIKDLLDEEIRSGDKIRNDNQRVFQTLEISTILGSKSFKVNNSVDNNVSATIENFDDDATSEELQQIKNDGVISKKNEPIRNKKVKYRRTKFTGAIILITLLCISITTFMMTYKSQDKKIKNENYLHIKPLDIKDKTLTMVKIGSTNKDEISSAITQKKIINDQKQFKNYLVENKVKVNKGIYYLSKSMSFKEIAKELQINNKVVEFKINKSNSIQKISENLEHLTKINSSKDELFKLSHSKAFIEKLHKINPSIFNTKEMTKYGIKNYFKGYLLPDNYTFSFNKTVEENTIDWFKKVSSKIKPYESKLKKMKLSVHKAITLASSLSEESNHNKSQYKILAGVYVNRLKQKVFLGIDSFNKYGYKISKNPNLKKLKDSKFIKNYNSKYNTYNNNKIPLSPIKNISIDELKSIVNYKKHYYNYYFVATKGNKKNKLVFASTLEEYVYLKGIYK